jgi:hypothetical protein
VIRWAHQEEYDDYIEFFTTLGEFRLPCRAFLPNLAVNVPATLDLGFAPVNEVTSEVIEIENVGQLPAPYEWKFGAPFTLSPSRGCVDVAFWVVE